MTERDGSGTPHPTADDLAASVSAAVRALRASDETVSAPAVRTAFRVTGVTLVVAAVVLAATVAWRWNELKPREPNPLDVDIGRLVAIGTARDRVFEFYRVHGRLPVSLEEAGPAAPSVAYRIVGDRFQLAVRRARRELGDSLTVTFLPTSRRPVEVR